VSLVAVLPELTPEGAERLSERISGRLETIATNYVAVMPLIREAISRNAHEVLGYPSPGAYIKDRFGTSLAQLGAELRREVVKELSSAGLSTRAIAPVVGVDQKTVVRDIAREAHASPVADVTPPDVPDLPANPQTGEVYEAGDTSPQMITETHTVKTVTGLDGKEYKTAPKAPKPILVGDAAAKDAAEQMAIHFGRALVNLSGLMTSARRAVVVEDWPLGREAATPDAQELASPEMFRAIAVALDQLADEWEKKNV